MHEVVINLKLLVPLHLFLKFRGPTSDTLADCGPQALTSLTQLL